MPDENTKKWRLRGEKKTGESIFEAFCRLRNIEKNFLVPKKISDLIDVKKIPGIEKAGEKIFQAIAKKEKFLIFGDFDLDGISGVTILYFVFKLLKADFEIFLPSRNDGYGLSKQIFKLCQQKKIQNLITVDCGISNFSEIEFGNSKKIKTIITDHHTLPKKFPAAEEICHPQISENQEIIDLTGAGVAFFLGKFLLEKKFKHKNLEKILKQISVFAALGTIADVGNLRYQNRILAQIGIEEMKKNHHPGISQILQLAKISTENITADSVAFFLAPRFNAAGRLSHPNLALRILLVEKNFAANLEKLNLERQNICENCYQIAEKKIIPSDNFICIFSEKFFSGISGLVAAKICEKFAVPAIVLSTTKNENFLTASCRGPSDFHFRKALAENAEILEKFGGHSAAAGFLIDKKNLEIFQKKFSRIVEKFRGKNPPPPEILADFPIKISEIFASDFEKIFSAAPFGAGNTQPIFEIKKAKLKNTKIIGKKSNHLIGEIWQEDCKISFVGFYLAEKFPGDFDQEVDFLISPEKNIFNGNSEIRAKIVDYKIRSC